MAHLIVCFVEKCEYLLYLVTWCSGYGQGLPRNETKRNNALYEETSCDLSI